MPSLQVKKAVAVSFLEAAKLTLEHLAAYRLELSQSHVDASPDLARLYGNLRRVRDYLQRCVSAFLEVVSLVLTSSDAALLVACCRRAVSAIEFLFLIDAIPTASLGALFVIARTWRFARVAHGFDFLEHAEEHIHHKKKESSEPTQEEAKQPPPV